MVIPETPRSSLSDDTLTARRSLTRSTMRARRSAGIISWTSGTSGDTAVPPVRSASRPGKTEQSRTHLRRARPSVKRKAPEGRPPGRAQPCEERHRSVRMCTAGRGCAMVRRATGQLGRPDGRALNCPLVPSCAGGSHCSHPTTPGRHPCLHGWLTSDRPGAPRGPVRERTDTPRDRRSSPTERSRSSARDLVNPSTFEQYRTKSNGCWRVVNPCRRGHETTTTPGRDERGGSAPRRRDGSGVCRGVQLSPERTPGRGHAAGVTDPRTPRCRRGPTRSARSPGGWRAPWP
jgi:hypothetical protein